MTIACHFSQLTIEFNQTLLFPPLSRSLTCQQNALIGHNGKGKSVLLRLLAQKITPTSGQITWNIPFIHVDQLTRLTGNTIAEALGINLLYQAFQRVDEGIASMQDIELLDGKWQLPVAWQSLLHSAQLPISMDTPIAHLSGGEQTRLALCRAFLHKNSFLLLDEPDNHLDIEGQQWLVKQLAQHKSGSLIISHNRQFLSHMDAIFELTEKGLAEYGGNYTLYETQKSAETASLEAATERITSQIKSEKRQQQVTQQKATQRRQQGESIRKSGSQCLLLLDMQKNRAEQRLSAVAKRHQRVMDDMQSQRQTLEEEKAHIHQQKITLNYQCSGQRLHVFVSDLCLPFGYQKPISFSAYSGEHWHIKGKNGCGKSTLLKCLIDAISPLSGEYRLNKDFCYLDQHLALLDKTIPVSQALYNYQSEISIEQWRTRLGMLRIRGDNSMLPLEKLSGGEQLKATLLALTHSPTPPAVLLLDEPDNHLDIESKQLLENLLAQYQGTLLLVSHDNTFVEQCGITHTLLLEDID
ncbi:glutathione-regulated potassium-efflux system ATP-binding protein [Proteus hauseri ATCC 700826]|uniref:Glutathione-regulated potassium-efflux system ATP-binding protein n=1 Tax=Proteus hauseri ATCC 700826 TaxID=1354271 RepID=A0AAJ3LTJ5_PROHU|nr:ATP-binding cassette domain-containing protein [Proteus hauseri]OAT46600.1 glutathione-regulated potassium-efflux system ATP-binding protein [Proteus hauseri ATCC 700826]